MVSDVARLLMTLLVGAALDGPPPTPLAPPADAQLLAINPNITIGDCVGGAPIDVSPTMSMRTFHGTLDGQLAGEVVFGQYCTGYYREQPQFCVTVPGPPGYYTFELTDAQSVDTTLAIVGESLEWPTCDDDSAGHDLLSKVVIWLEPGAYYVHVGAFSQGQTARFTMTVQAGDHW